MLVIFDSITWFAGLERVFVYDSFNLACYSNFSKIFLAILGNFFIQNLELDSVVPPKPFWFFYWDDIRVTDLPSLTTLQC